MTLPRIGLGCAAQGNLFHERSEDEAYAVFDAAWDAGIRHFDTAPHYGLGLSEQRLGRFLATKPRDEYVLSTKVGRLLRPDPAWDGAIQDAQGFAVPAGLRREWDLTPSGVRASLEESLTRLGLDRVDILYVHDPEVSGLDGAAEQGMESVAGLRDEGLVDLVGTGSMAAATLLAAVNTGLADVLMVAGRYTLLDQTVAPAVLDACDEHGTRIVAAAVFNSGLLADVPKPDATFDYAQVAPEMLARALQIAEVCSSYGVELATAALHYPLLDPRVESVVVGAAEPEHVMQNLTRLGEPVPDQLWQELADQDLVPRCA
jgi:D-threo-aldose 1-dehydrogenase